MRVGDFIGRFRILRELGKGGMGSVVAALDPGTGREVAIKVLHGLEPEQRLRFIEEGRGLARLRDRGLVRVHEVDLAGPTPYLVMELLPGQTLQSRLQRGPLPVVEALVIAQEVGRTLGRLHDAGVVHRDLKPANVVLHPDGRPVLVDLGLALLLDRSARLTRSGVVMGTPGYMAPEQVHGRIQEMGPACDVYGLGATLYALLTGRPPFQGPNALAVLTAIAVEPPDPPSSHRPVDPGIDRLVLACLAKDPRKRPELGLVLEELRGLSSVRPPRRVRPAALAAAGLLTLVAGGLTWAMRAPRPDPPSTAEERCAGGQRLLERGDLAGASAEFERALQLDPGLAPGHLGRGLVHEQRGELQEALADFERAIARAPHLARAFAARGRVRLKLNDPKQAGADLELAIALDPGLAMAYATRAVLHARTGDGGRALADYDRALELDPRRWEVWSNRGDLRGRLGDLGGALDDLGRALELDPSYAPARVNRARLRLEQGDLAGARADVDRAIADDPELGPAWSIRGALRYERGELPQALKDLDRAVELLPDDAYTVVRRGDVWARLGKAEPACEDYDRGLALEPQLRGLLGTGASRAYGERGTSRLERGELAEAQLDLELALAIDPTNVVARIGRSDLLQRQGGFAEASAEIEKAIEVAPNDPRVWLGRGGLRLHRYDLEGAESDLDRAIELGPRVPIAYAMRGDLKLLRDDHQGALADYDRALELWPEHPPFLHGRAHVRRLGNDFAGAREDLDRALATAPNDVQARVERGLVRRFLDDVAGAREDFDRALELDPRCAAAWRHRAYVRDLGDLDGALADLERFLELAPHDPDAPAVQAEIARLRAGR